MKPLFQGKNSNNGELERSSNRRGRRSLSSRIGRRDALPYDAAVALRLLVSAQDDPNGRSFQYDFDSDRAQILLGRRGGVDVLLPHAAVSLVHARIERRAGDGGGYQLIDDRSTNGTLLNGARIAPGQWCPIERGDQIAIGEFLLAVADAEGGEVSAGESSISIARRMVAEVMGVLGPGAEHPTLTVAQPGQGSPRDAQLAVAEVGRRYTIGRAPGCDLVLADPSVAPEHLLVRRDYRGVSVVDLGSPHGLYINDRYAAEERGLRDGDLLQVGKITLRFSDPAEVYLRRLAEVPTPDRGAGSAATESASPLRSRGEAAVIAVASLVALLAVAGLVYLWSS